VSVPGEQVDRLSKGDWTKFEDYSLSGHSSAQPLRTHELHGTALLTCGKRGGLQGDGEFKIHLSHFNFDLEIWESVNPCCVGEGDKPTCDIPRMTRRLGGHR